MQPRFVDKFNIEELPGVHADVFDVEVEDNHNFYANGILCHNSMYSTSKIPQALLAKQPDANTDTIINYIEAFYESKVEPFIKRGFEELAEYMNANNKMRMKLETISDRGFWLSSKKYAIRVIKAEGVRFAKPKAKIKGIEIVSSTTPKSVKPTLRKVVDIMLENMNVNEIRTLCCDFNKEFLKMNVHEIGIPTTMNKTSKYQDLPPGTHIHIRGSIVFNQFIKTRKHITAGIQDGDKIKYVYLKEPNFLQSHVISFMDEFPEELLRFVDYDKQFDVVFLTPTNNKLEKLGYEIKIAKKNNRSIFRKKPVGGDNGS